MKLYYIILVLLFSIISCSKNENERIEPIACFNIVQDTIKYQGTIEIEDCSTDAFEYSYSLNGQPITLAELKSTKHLSGIQRVLLKVTSETGIDAFTTHNFFVESKYDSFYTPAELNGGHRLLAFGKNPILGNMYAVFKRYSDSKLYYADIADDLMFSLTQIENRSENTGIDRALCFFDKDGTVYIDVPRSTAVSSQRSTYWVNPTTGESYDPISLVSYNFDAGYIKLDDQFYSAGANLKYNEGPNKYIPSINNYRPGNSIILKEFDLGERSGVIGNFIPYKNGYLAYAGTFDLLWGPDKYGVTNQKTQLLELDSNFDLIKYHELSELGENLYSSMPAYNSQFHMMVLPNNKILLYGLSSFRILNDDLTIHHEEILVGAANQSVLLLENEIILSERSFISKYDFNGNRLAEFDYGQFSIAGILPYNGNIIFMSEVLFSNSEGPDLSTLFMGVLDLDLNLISINP